MCSHCSKFSAYLQESSCLTLTTALRGKYHYYAHFTKKVTQLQVAGPGFQSSLAIEPVLLVPAHTFPAERCVGCCWDCLGSLGPRSPLPPGYVAKWHLPAPYSGARRGWFWKRAALMYPTSLRALTGLFPLTSLGVRCRGLSINPEAWKMMEPPAGSSLSPITKDSIGL